jgi:hypothetical protein
MTYLKSILFLTLILILASCSSTTIAKNNGPTKAFKLNLN